MTSRLSGPMKHVVALAAAACVVVSSEAADACGGFFCSRTPVDQTAERIIFTVNTDDTVTAYIQISYSGERDAFAWILPVPTVPALDVGFSQLAMQALDLATEPRYIRNGCGVFVNFPGAWTFESGGADAGVTVLAREAVGPFETVTLEGASADVLVIWLQQNGYRINDSMVPYIQPYVEERMKFVAMKLLPDADVSDIEPIIMTYGSSLPMIPIRLTAVAAQPEMGVVAWFLSDQRYGPQGYADVTIPDSLIQFDQYGSRNNYLTVVSQEVDKIGGHAFVTEYAQPTSELITQFENAFVPPDNPEAVAANQAVLDLLRQHAFITRLYTRISAEEMTRDPQFYVAADQSLVDNVHDLTDPNVDYTQCNSMPAPPCTFTYCGREGVCMATLDGADACVCDSDATARPTTTANGELSLYCEPLSVNFMAAGEGVGALGFSDACEGFDCGLHGECVSMNGNPTCACEAGYGAVASTELDMTGASTTKVTCSAVGDVIPPLPILPPVGEPDMPPVGGGPVGMDPVGTDPVEMDPNGLDPVTEPVSPSASDESGCGCRLASRTTDERSALPALLGLGVLALRRRRRSFPVIPLSIK